MERLRQFSIEIEIDTNKGTTSREFRLEEDGSVADVLRAALAWAAERYPEEVEAATSNKKSGE
jgi:hypothetical protein